MGSPMGSLKTCRYFRVSLPVHEPDPEPVAAAGAVQEAVEVPEDQALEPEPVAPAIDGPSWG